MLADPAHREVARIAAERSAVLLRNSGDLLPLDPGPGIGRGDRPAGRLEAGHVGAVGFDFDLDETVSVLDGIRHRIGESVPRRVRARNPARPAGIRLDVRHVPRQRPGGSRWLRRRRGVPARHRGGRGADIAIVAVGEWQNMIGEAASRSSLELPGRQLELLQAVVETGTPVVLLVLNGRPLDLRWAAEHVPAILDIWYPGTQGGTAVANLLFGDVAPGGKLPFSWPRTVGQVPMVVLAHPLA